VHSERPYLTESHFSRSHEPLLQSELLAHALPFGSPGAQVCVVASHRSDAAQLSETFGLQSPPSAPRAAHTRRLQYRSGRHSLESSHASPTACLRTHVPELASQVKASFSVPSHAPMTVGALGSSRAVPHGSPPFGATRARQIDV
jgi:hypothetical protein